MPKIEFFFDFSSPWTYLAIEEVQDLAAQPGAALVGRPMLLGGVFKAIEGPIVPIETFPEAKRLYLY